MDTGSEVTGWAIESGGKVLSSGGVGTGRAEDDRRIPRSFGAIVREYMAR